MKFHENKTLAKIFELILQFFLKRKHLDYVELRNFHNGSIFAKPGKFRENETHAKWRNHSAVY